MKSACIIKTLQLVFSVINSLKILQKSCLIFCFLFQNFDQTVNPIINKPKPKPAPAQQQGDNQNQQNGQTASTEATNPGDKNQPPPHGDQSTTEKMDVE